VVTLLAPVLVTLALLFMASSPPEAANAPSGKGTVEVGFTASFDPKNGAGNTPQSYQRILLNVIAVRLNPSTAETVGEDDPKWQVIGAPAGVGSSNPFGVISTGQTFGGAFGPNGSVIALGQGRSEVQIELNRLQDQAIILNSGLIPGQAYHHIELVLDPNNPATFVPLCAGATRGEGCITYAATLLNPNNPILVPTPVTFNLAKKAIVPLVLNIDPGIQAPPVTSSDLVTINPVITVVPQGGGTGLNQALGLISGTLTNPGLKETVTAELAGTNQIVASVVVQPKTGNSSTYSLNLPAPLNGDTLLYDLYASAQARSIEMAPNVPVVAGQQSGVSPLNFNAKKVPSQTISGKIADACDGTGIQSATIQLLKAVPGLSPAPDCTLNPALGCMVIGTASTDDTGRYPSPGNTKALPQFNLVPSGSNYTLKISAPGYNSTTLQVKSDSGVLRCTSSGFPNNACSANLERGEIDATVALPSPNSGPALNVLLVAEEAGTNTIKNVAMATIQSGKTATLQPVPIIVPDSTSASDPVMGFNVFGEVQDLFGTPTNAAPERATGHSISITSSVPGSSKCPAPGTAPATTLTGFSCVGHSSISGTVPSADNHSVVVLASNGIQLMQTPPAPNGSVNAGQFSFCAPADPTAAYTVQHFERQPNGTLSPAAGPVAVAPAPPIPFATATPCQSICNPGPPSPANTCLLCVGTSGVVLP
jgi:hypothetical protein